MTHSALTTPTLGTLALRALQRYPQRTAFAWEGGTLSYRATSDLIGRIQHVFAHAGLQRGHRVCMLTSNLVETWCAGMAALCSGMGITWLHPLGSLNDHLFQLEDFKTDILIIDVAVHGARGAELAAAMPGLRAVYTTAPSAFGQDLLLAAEQAGNSPPQNIAQYDDLAITQYTGGTTGRSKGAARDHAGYSSLLLNVLADFELPDSPRYLLVAPMTHVAGSKIQPVLTRGGTIYLMNGFAPDRIFEVIKRERINMTLMVPTMVYALLDHPGMNDADLSSLELLLYGAAPMSPTRLIEGLERMGPVFSQLYGQSEGYPLTVLGRADHDPKHPELFSSCGRATSGVTLCLLDDEGNEVPAGEVGELCARGPHVMQRYLNQPELSAETLEGGWLHTGDMARVDARGYFFIVDRKKDMIVSGGFNIYSRDVEDVIATHPAVAQVAVVGAPDPKWGEAVIALVVCRAGATVSVGELGELVKAQKGSLYVPKRVEFVECLPVTGLGKLDKKALRARFWEGQLRQVG
jgi:fatty-acyl-CoA synthase